ncbi:MAG: hypothetical protein COB79_00895 [Zetaproteobacteria bacterium]|nr:MAG: hypothetical protein COB79_00895 [Zetaproteobacteria bacterium]
MSNAQHNLNSKQQREKQRALALAALTQVTSLIENIAHEGKLEHQRFACCMDAFFDPTYLGERSFYAGAIQAKRILQGQDIAHAKTILTHSAALITLEKKLAKQPQALQHIEQSLARVEKQIQYFNDPYHGNIIAAIAHLYGETVSQMTPQLIVRGKPEHLTPANKEKIRCLLFSGIRAAWIWRINGGNTLRLVFGRKTLIRELEKIRLTT